MEGFVHDRATDTTLDSRAADGLIRGRRLLGGSLRS